jgi:flagellar basal-body rod protein FlgC
MDMREAEHSYSANLAVMQATRSMLNRTIDRNSPGRGRVTHP